MEEEASSNKQQYDLQAAASAADLQNPISGFFGFLIGWCIPNPDFCVVQPCRGLFFQRKTTLSRKNMMFNDFLRIFHKKMDLI